MHPLLLSVIMNICDCNNHTCIEHCVGQVDYPNIGKINKDRLKTIHLQL